MDRGDATCRPIVVLKLSYTKRLIALGLTGDNWVFRGARTALWDSRERDREQARQAAANLIATISSDIELNLELYDLSLQAVVDAINLL